MSEHKIEGKQRENIQIGSQVEVIQKQHQRSGELTEGTVKRLLTNSSTHPYYQQVLRM